MAIDTCTHGNSNVENKDYSQSYSTNNKNAVDEALQKWVLEQILVLFQSLGHVDKEGKEKSKTGQTQADYTPNQSNYTPNNYASSSELNDTTTNTTPGSTSQPSNYEPIFNGETQSVYGMSALILLMTMKNKQGIINNRLQQIEGTNRSVQEITTAISNLKAAKASLEKDGDKTKVDKSDLQVLADTNLGTTGKLDEAGTDKFFRELFDKDDWSDMVNGEGQTEINKAQIDAVIEKLTTQSEALSTQNQTRNIKLQQQISELQVTTQMTSAIIDQIKTLGSGIAQRI